MITAKEARRLLEETNNEANIKEHEDCIKKAIEEHRNYYFCFGLTQADRQLLFLHGYHIKQEGSISYRIYW